MPFKKRVAWFLQLKSIFPAPRRSLAPARNRFRRPRTETDTNVGIGVGSKGPGLSGVARYSAAIRSTKAAATEPARARGAYQTQSSPSRVGPAAPGQDLSPSRRTVSAPHYLRPLTRQILMAVSTARGTSVITELPPTGVASEPVPGIHGIAASSVKQPSGYRATAKAAGLPLSRRADYSSKVVGHGVAPFGRPMAPPAVPPNSDIAAAVLDQVALGERGLRAAERSGQEPGHKAPSRATLHIDGHALGRWTVQHLEKVLGRPSAGMTGVDPRASTPRTRVSPF